MRTNLHAFRVDGRPAIIVGKVLGEPRMAGITAALRPRPAGASSGATLTGGWTPAHTEAVRFLGECVAAGAVLGFVTELTRPVWEQRHG